MLEVTQRDEESILFGDFALATTPDILPNGSFDDFVQLEELIAGEPTENLASPVVVGEIGPAHARRIFILFFLVDFLLHLELILCQLASVLLSFFVLCE